MSVAIHKLPNGTQFSVDSEELAQWLREHGPDCKQNLEARAASTGRDNYGLVGKAGKKAKPRDGRWKSFQEAVK